MLLLFSGNGSPFAQIPNDIKFTNITDKNGLPDTRINSITQDSRGFMWFGSKEGLIRYDGKNYKTWYSNIKDSNSFNSNNVTVVGEHKPNAIIFLSSGKLFSINSYNHKIIPIQSFKEKWLFGQPVQINKEGWVAISRDTLFLVDTAFNIKNRIFLGQYFNKGETVIPFKLTDEKILIYSGSVFKNILFDLATKTFIQVNIVVKLNPLAPSLHPLVYNKETGQLYFTNFFDGWFSIPLDLNRSQTYKAKPEILLGSGSARDAILYSHNLLLHGGDAGLIISDFKSKKEFNTNSVSDKPIVDNVILALYKAKDGKVWIGTANGISVFDLKLSVIQYINNKNVFLKDAVKSIVKGADSSIYILMLNKSLVKLNNDLTLKFLDKDLVIGYTWSAIAHNNSIIATGGGKKILSYDVKTGTTSSPTYLKAFYGNADLVTLAFKAKNGDLWYSINVGGGLVHNPAGTNQYIHYTNATTPPSFSQRHFQTVAEAANGDIWFGYIRSTFLLKWNSIQKRFEEFDISKFAGASGVAAGIKMLFIDAQNNLWVALDGYGVIKYNLNDKVGNYFDIASGLPTSDVAAFAEDNVNRIWMTTAKGLCCYQAKQNKFTTFSEADGLPEDVFYSEGLFFDRQKNLLYLGGTGSLAWFNPDELINKKKEFSPLVYIDGMFVNSQPYYFDETKNIGLKSFQNNLQFEIAAVDYNNNGYLVFQYQLIGSSDNWIDLNENRVINFSNIEPGKYTLNVRCGYKGATQWFENKFPITFTVNPAWYATWWFIAFAVLTTLAAIWYTISTYYRYKIGKEKAVEQERTRIATDMHDDFGANVSRIKFLSEKMKVKYGTNAELSPDLNKISNYSDEMADKMNEVIWALNKRYDTLGDLVAFSRSYAMEYLTIYEIQLIFSDNDVLDQKISGELRRTVFLTLKESLHNVVKHAKANKVIVVFEKERNILTLKISDNGIGFNKNNIRRFANGIENIKKRVAKINGTYSIETNQGTQIVLRMDLKQ